ncbi:hypothetical protein VOLCADRAFT_92517 [Volvox carteri f. nagariensis]|uniref:Uncharacterized protein n=1 Tax=Volvox carteri f. nagariensis TaxID=3068 RepID=D8TZV6_VOLCA|nr:uncharacterized protein VOLCADRAFT_92517 [Volvox carteri f. nagariensis]EFJ47082.1 hypothetical protein VOLCADRAFT_92517 [Volvox carteri f. nagariensis]|eukprot:XP_002951977.1 hypothetical protein VOLCADRAFT_92517 [Volvox carteri f. nagariensis]
MKIHRIESVRRLPERLKSRTLQRSTVRVTASTNEGGRTVRVQFSVHYRAHRHQILCIGGSQLPLGWSFLSIAKMPMSWNPGDKWTCEEWTNLADKFSQGYVEVPYRTAADPGRALDPREIVAMAIVAWQPGPNRFLQVPDEDELKRLESGLPPEKATENLSLDESGIPKLIRDDAWGWP